MSYSGRNRNSVYPSTDGTHLAVYNGRDVGGGGIKLKPSPRKKAPKPKLWTEEIEALRPCDQFFIRQTNIETEDSIAPANYDIRNGTGNLVFKGIESTDPEIRDLYQDEGKPPFVVTIFDMKAGKEMLKINANLRQGVMLVYVKQSTEDKVIGIVRRVHSRSPCCPSHFSLERPNGAVLLKIRSSSPVSNLCCCCTCLSTCPFFKKLGRAFHILMSDEVTNIGNIGYFHQNFGSEDPEDGLRGAMITASFPGDATASSKALILASLFMLDSIYFQRSRRPLKKFKISKTCYIIIIIVTIVGIIGVLAAVFGGGGYQGNRKGYGGRPSRPGGFQADLGMDERKKYTLCLSSSSAVDCGLFM